jgi:flagellin
MRINQNIAAFNAYRNLSQTQGAQASSLEKLSSGFRINRAADDAAGLVRSESLRSQVGGLKMAVRNAQDGISLIQTAEGALTETTSILQRMRDLAVQSANGGANSQESLDANQAEYTALSAELNRIADNTKFGDKTLLDGTYGAKAAERTGFVATGTYTVVANDAFAINVNGTGNVTATLSAGTYTGAQLAAHMESAIQTALSGGTAAQQALANKISVSSETVGAGFALTISAELAATQSFVLTDGVGTPLADFALVGTSTAASGTGGNFQLGDQASQTVAVTIGDMSARAGGLNLAGTSISSEANATTALGSLDTALKNVSTQRANLGAFQNRFESTIRNINVTVENLSAAESRIRDTDMADEMVKFTRSQILSQAGTAMLAQANQVPQGVLSLLR